MIQCEVYTTAIAFFGWLSAGSSIMAEEFQGKRVIVTGGGGYFGHKLGNALKAKGAEVLAFDISWPLDKTAYKQLECVQVRYERSLRKN